jgi:bisphosphoglycerate-dependent phosphoglycerate mutase
MPDYVLHALGTIMGFIITGIMVYVGRYIKHYLVQKHLMNIALTFVQYVERNFPTLVGTEKAIKVEQYIAEELGKFGIRVTTLQIQSATQWAYNEMKKGFIQGMNETPIASTPINPTGGK